MNPATFEGLRVRADSAMTVSGAVMRTGILLVLVVVAAAYTWDRMKTGGNAGAWVLGGAIGGFVVAMITCFKKEWSPVTAPVYAILEGLFLGAISAVFAARFGGIVFQAVTLTFGTLLCLLLAYQTGLIRATEKFKLGVFAATGAVCLIYVVSLVLGFFGISVPYIHQSGAIGIGFSVVVVVIAALNLVLDFDFIENGARQGAPKYMEWYAAFGLLVTLVWLYLEMLRLLAKIRNR